MTDAEPVRAGSPEALQRGAGRAASQLLADVYLLLKDADDLVYVRSARTIEAYVRTDRELK
jgi:hypothetical protein